MDIFKLSESEREDLRLLHYQHQRKGGSLWHYAKNEFLTAREMCESDSWMQQNICKIPYGKFALYGAKGVIDHLKALHSGTNAAGAF